MGKLDLVLGIDSSTQSTTAVVLDRASFATVAEAKVRYRDDPRLVSFGLTEGAPILPPREKGEADQPAVLFLAALEALFSDLGPDILGRVAAIDISAQQHGQVWLGSGGAEAIAALRGGGARGAGDLAARLGPGLAYDRAPIWMSANTQVEADELRAALGGREGVTARSGSDSPLRFSGVVLRRVAKRFPEIYARTYRFHLISSFLAGVLAGEGDAPIDWGNGSGTSLMDWSRRRWDPQLIAAIAAGLAGGPEALASRLPPLAHPLTIVGRAAAYFAERFGLSPECAIVAGSGDNPQGKVLASGALLSLGTSFVLMVEGEKPHVSANAMYDGLGRPFLFGCRTNGALAWESVRTAHGLAANDFAASESALASEAPGSAVRIVQNERESFPYSPATSSPSLGSFARDYSAAVDSSLGLMAVASAPFAGRVREVAVTGGAASSRGVLARVAAIWGARALPIADAGAAAGAAVAAACALVGESERGALADRARAVAARPGLPVEPEAASIRAYRGKGGYLERLEKEFASLKD
ncbi:MAG: FGGY family carbohydrate kinase [Rectinemataceae bacterium]|jgi:xylulokinase